MPAAARRALQHHRVADGFGRRGAASAVSSSPRSRAARRHAVRPRQSRRRVLEAKGFDLLWPRPDKGDAGLGQPPRELDNISLRNP